MSNLIIWNCWCQGALRFYVISEMQKTFLYGYHLATYFEVLPINPEDNRARKCFRSFIFFFRWLSVTTFDGRNIPREALLFKSSTFFCSSLNKKCTLPAIGYVYLCYSTHGLHSQCRKFMPHV